MKNRTTLILLSSILLLGAFIWIQEAVLQRKSERKAQEVRLFNIDGNTLTQVEFRLTNAVIRCVKENGVWMAGDESGSMGRADVALVRRMVAGLNSIGKGNTITSKNMDLRGFDLSEYGLDPANIQISAVDNQGQHEWLIGRRAPLGDMVYAKKAESEEIYTVTGKLMFIIPTSHDHLRDRVLFTGGAASVRRIEIRGSAGFVQMIKDPATGWKLQQPVSAAADPKEVDGFIEQLYRFRIEEFVADNVSDFSVYGLQDEVRQISIGNGDGSTRMLIVGDDVKEKPGFVYARRADDNSVFTLSADVLKHLNVPANRLRNARVLSVPAATVSYINVEHGAEQVSMQVENGGGWKIVSPFLWEADPQTIGALIMFWDNAVITEFDMENDNAEPAWVFTFGSHEAGVTNRIEVLQQQGRKDGLLVRRDDNPAVYQINIPAVPTQAVDPLLYKSRRVWNLDVDGINKVSIIRDGVLTDAIARQESGVFVAVERNGGRRVNEQGVGKMLDQLKMIKTTEYVTSKPRNLEIYGLASPSFEVHVGLSNSNELGRVLLVGRETPEGYYSMVKGRDVVFYLDKSQINVLSDGLGGMNEPALDNASE